MIARVCEEMREHDWVLRKRAAQAKRSKRRPVTARQRSNRVKNPRV